MRLWVKPIIHLVARVEQTFVEGRVATLREETQQIDILSAYTKRTANAVKQSHVNHICLYLSD